MGRRMSGGEAWAIVEPSTNWTIEWTTDCGWTTTSILSSGMSKSRCASITSRPLLTRLAELVVTIRPMSQVGWARASCGETSCSCSRVRPRNGPPEAVRISRSTSAARAGAQALGNRGVLRIHRDDLAFAGRGLDQRAADDQRFLVGQCQGGPGLERGQGRRQADGAGDAVEDDVGVDFRDPRRGVRAGHEFRAVADQPGRAGGVVDQFLQHGGVAAGNADRLGPGVHGLPRQEFEVAAAGAECHDLKKVRGAVDDVNRLRADGTGGPEEDDLARLHGLSIPHSVPCPGSPAGTPAHIDATPARRNVGNVEWAAWFDAPEYEFARQVLQRGIASLYFVAFLSSLNQFPALLGERGLLAGAGIPRRLQPPAPALPVPVALLGPAPPGVCWAGLAIAAALVAGLPQLGPPWIPLLAFLALWLLYMSIVNVGQTFYGFGWEMLLLEAGFTVAFLGSDQTPPPRTILILLAWLVFRLEFGAGMIKIRGGREWRDLTALYYHHETQPMPGPLSRQAHLLPKPFHRLEVLGNHFAQLVVPFFLFAPQPLASAAAGIIIFTQLWLVASGNFAWLNWMAILLAFAAVSDPVAHAVLPVIPLDSERPALRARPRLVAGSRPGGQRAAGGAQLPPDREPALPLSADERQLQPLAAGQRLWRLRHGHEAADRDRGGGNPCPRSPDDDSAWREYGFRGKPGDVRRIPRQWAPYHLRLDWLMWFLPLRTVHVSMVLRLPGQAAGGRPAHAAAVARRPVRRRAPPLGAGPQLPLPLLHPGGVPCDRPAVDPDPAAGGRSRRCPCRRRTDGVHG